MMTPEQRKLIAIFANGGVSADKQQAQDAARAYLHSGITETTEGAINQLHAMVEHYDGAKHKTNHDEMASALLALVDLLHVKG